jgi:ribonuclease HI
VRDVNKGNPIVSDIKEETKQGEVEVEQGMMIYADGSAAPTNPGPTGWGIHGYLYADVKPKKGSGNSAWNLTKTGYVAKNDASQKGSMGDITPLHYFDGFGSIVDPGISAANRPTNNVGELVGATRAMEHAIAYNIKRLHIQTDSEYTRKGIESWVDNWQRNNWLKRDGMPPANIDYWKHLVTVRKQLTDRGVDVKISWVKGHNKHLGNEIADKHAGLGSLIAQTGEIRNEITSRVPDGYWKYDAEKHPMVANPRMYFNTMAEYQKPGEYYLGNHGTEDDMLGKRMSDGCYSVVRLKKPDEAMEIVRTYSSQLAQGLDTIIMVRLDQLFSTNTHKEVTSYGSVAMPRAKPYRLDLNCLDEEPGGGFDEGGKRKRKPLTREFRPPKLAMRAVESVSDLIEKLDMYLAKDPKIVTTDLTGILYETKEKPVGKKGEVVLATELQERFIVGFPALDVQANYQVGEGIGQTSIKLLLSMDLLSRNSLKRLERCQPKVTLITWRESAQAFRYATVIEADGDVGIWAGVYGNQRLVPG